MNSHRSALSLISLQNLEADSMISRFMKGISKIRPSQPKYNSTWDPEQVLSYLQTMGTNSDLSLKQLSYKLVTMLALVTGHHLQTISLIRISNIIRTSSGLQILITDPTKTSRTNSMQPCLQIPYFAENPQLCVVSALEVYKSRTHGFRKPEQDFLFLTHKRPHGMANKQSLSQWVKETLKAAGVDITVFQHHSTRHASTSVAHMQGISIESIMQTAGWSRTTTFTKFYHRPWRRYSYVLLVKISN